MRLSSVPVRIRRLGRARALGALTAVLWGPSAALGLVYASLTVRDGAMATAAALLVGGAALLGTLGTVPAIATPVALIAAWVGRPFLGAVEVTAAGIEIERGDKRIVVPHEAVAEGVYLPAQDLIALRLETGDVLQIEHVRRAEDADALLDAIAAGSTERALDLALRRATRARTLTAIALIPLCGLLIFLAAARDSVGAVMGVAAFLAVAWTLFLTRFGAPARLIAGHDGVALEGVRGQSFLSYRRLLGVRPSPEGAVLEIDGAQEIPVRMQKGGYLQHGLSARRRDQLIAKVEAEIAAARAAGEELLGAAQLERGGRTIAAWRAGLREIMSRPTAGYRAASLDPEHLLRILETRAMAPERRLGAALALSGTADPAVQQRLRVFIDSSASDALRGALEKATAGDLEEDALEGALRQMDRR